MHACHFTDVNWLISKDPILPISRNRTHSVKKLKASILPSALRYIPGVPILLKAPLLKITAATLRTEHNVGIDVHQRFELANDTNRLWIVIHGQKLEIAWTLIYNIVVKTGVNTLTSNCNRMLFAVTCCYVLGLLKHLMPPREDYRQRCNVLCNTNRCISEYLQ